MASFVIFFKEIKNQLIDIFKPKYQKKSITNLVIKRCKLVSSTMYMTDWVSAAFMRWKLFFKISINSNVIDIGRKMYWNVRTEKYFN